MFSARERKLLAPFLISLARNFFELCFIADIAINTELPALQNIKLLAKDLSLREQRIVCSNCCENVDATLRIVAPELLNVRKDGDNYG